MMTTTVLTTTRHQSIYSDRTCLSVSTLTKLWTWLSPSSSRASVLPNGQFPHESRRWHNLRQSLCQRSGLQPTHSGPRNRFPFDQCECGRCLPRPRTKLCYLISFVFAMIHHFIIPNPIYQPYYSLLPFFLLLPSLITPPSTVIVSFLCVTWRSVFNTTLLVSYCL